MGWMIEPAIEAFPKYARQWDKLNQLQGGHVLLDSEFVGALVGHFGSRETLLAVSTDICRPGMALLTKVKTGYWETFQPSQAPLGLVLLGSRDQMTQQILGLIRSLPGYALQLSILQQDQEFSAFTRTNLSPAVAFQDYITTARVSVAGRFTDYWSGRSKDLQVNVARRRRRLAERKVSVQLVIRDTPEAMGECIREYARLEESGWKGAEGTAVSAEKEQGLFYKEILERFCCRGQGVVYQLLFDGKTVASQLGLRRNGMLVLLKTAYDEASKEYSPGFLLQEEIFRSVFELGETTSIEFYGRVREGWTTKWTNELRMMYHANWYRHAWIATGHWLLRSSSRFWPFRLVRPR